MPGDTVNVEVTFPDPYHSADLAGRDALFVTVINYIMDEGEHVLTDEFVETRLSFDYGWTTVAQMEDEIRTGLREMAIRQYVQQYLQNDVVVIGVPPSMVTYQERALLDDAMNYAIQNNIELEELLAWEGFDNTGDFVEAYREENEWVASNYLVIQAIAEAADISVSDGVLGDFLSNEMGFDAEDIEFFTDMYGVPYLKQFVLGELVFKYVVDNAVLED
jgi:trigger factor